MRRETGGQRRAREGAPSSIAAGLGFWALLNWAGHFCAGAHAAPRGWDRHLALSAASPGALGGLHLQLPRPVPGAGEEGAGQPQSSSTCPAAFLGLRGWEAGGGGGLPPAPLRRRLLLSRLGGLGPSERPGGSGRAFRARVSAGSLGEQLTTPPYLRFCMACCETGPRDPLVLFS